MNIWDEFSAFYDWELSIVNPQQNDDIVFWEEVIKSYGPPVLEFACGSGRLTIPLAESGLEITALDFSENMLRLLEKKAIEKKLKIDIIQADMTNFHIANKFSFALLGYFALQQLTSLSAQEKCLKTIHRQLKTDGVLGLDIYPCVCEGPDEMESELLYSAAYPFDNSQISMYSSYKIDRLNLIKTWKDEYIKCKNGKEEHFFNTISLMECSPAYMELLLDKCGFKIIEQYGSFDKKTVTLDSNNILYLCKKK